VAEPSIEDTKTILLGLREKYDLHHGVKINEKALEACVELSNRYITDRFLPDKAVDLMDEAMSALRLEIESEPPEFEKLRKDIQRLVIEQEALKNEKDSSLRLKAIAKELADLREQSTDIEAKWKAEKKLLKKLNH